MADIKISQLGAAIAVGDTDLVPIVSGGNTLKATAAQVKEHSIGNTNISSIGDGSVTGAINALNTDKQPKTLATPLTIGGVSKTTVEDALSGLVSENQTLANDKVNTSDIANNLTTTTSGKVLDARQGKALNDKETQTRTIICSITNDGNTNTQGYTLSSGVQFYHNGELCEAIDDITAGSALVLNSNYKLALSITDQVRQVTQSVIGSERLFSKNTVLTAPDDGYFIVSVGVGISAQISLMYGTDTPVAVQTVEGTSGTVYGCIYVRKGMRVYVYSADSITIAFRPLI